MSISRIKKDDIVIVIAGDDAGKTGKVLSVNKAKGRAVVEGLHKVKKTIRRSQQVPEGDIVEIESSIDLSNLMPYDPKAKKGVRVSVVREGDKPVRQAKGSGHRFE